MQLFCIGDIALTYDHSSQQQWAPPGGLRPNNEVGVLFNMELPLGDQTNPKPRTSGPRLLSDLQLLKKIRGWSPGFATLATNHILDAGAEGLANTIDSLNQAGFITVGAGRSNEEIVQPLLWETKEGQLAIVNWVFPETHPDWMSVPGPNCWPGVEEAKRILQVLKNQVDWVIIVVHWSDELFAYPCPEDRTTARELAQMGADLVIGHHPHVVRGLEIINSCPVFYSIGNFYFSDISDHHGGWIEKQAPRNREGLGVQITLERGQKPEYRVLSFWQRREQVVLDPIRRAQRRMELVSRPLQRFPGPEYAHWHAVEHARFDKWGYRWHFGMWQLGRRGLARLFSRLWTK